MGYVKMGHSCLPPPPHWPPGPLVPSLNSKHCHHCQAACSNCGSSVKMGCTQLPSLPCCQPHPLLPPANSSNTTATAEWPVGAVERDVKMGRPCLSLPLWLCPLAHSLAHRSSSPFRCPRQKKLAVLSYPTMIWRW